MEKFEYTLPSGAKFTVTAPPGSTKEQADLLFYSQVAAGALAGYTAGQTLTNVTVTPLTFELSRQSRGTAGVPGTISGVYNYRNEILAGLYYSAVSNYNASGGGVEPGPGPNPGPDPGPGPYPGPGPAPTPWPPGPGPNPDPYWPIPPKPEPYYPPVPPNPSPVNPPTPGPGPAPGPTPGPVPPPGPPIPNPIPPLPVVPPIVPPDKTGYDGRERDVNTWDGAVPLDGRSGAVITDLYTKTESSSQGFDGYLQPSDIEIAASILAKYPAIHAMADLSTTPITAPVDQADVILAKGDRIGAIRVGALLPFQVQTLQAQIANQVDQPSTEISQAKGVGKFGLSCYQLEVAGYVKPGTSAKYIDVDVADFVKIMNSPAIWTGKNGVRTLDAYLAAENLQDSSNNILLNAGYNGLVAANVIDPPIEREVSYDTAWVYTNTGLQPLGSNSMFENPTNGEVGTASFNTDPSGYYDTLESGTTSEDSVTNMDLADYNFNAVRNSSVKLLYRDLGALTAVAGKFGPELTALWAGTGTADNYSTLLRNAVDSANNRDVLLNQIGGAASLLNGTIGDTNDASDAIMVGAIDFRGYRDGGSFSDIGYIINLTRKYGISYDQARQELLAWKTANGYDVSNYYPQKAAEAAANQAANQAAQKAKQKEISKPAIDGTIPTDVVQRIISPMVQLGSSMTAYGKSAQFAMNYTDQVTASGDLYSLNSLTDFTSDFIGTGDMTQYMMAQLTSGDFLRTGDMNQLINQVPGLANFGSLFNILNVANMFGNLGSMLGALQIFGNLFGGNNAFVSNTELGIGYSDTVDRDTVDVASQKILGDPKIPQPVYSYPGNFWMNLIMDLAKANQSLNDAARQGDAFLSGSGNVFYRG